MCAGVVWEESNNEGESKWGDEQPCGDWGNDQASLGDVGRDVKHEQTSWGDEQFGHGWGDEEASTGDVGRGAMPEQASWGDEQSGHGWGSQHASLDAVARGAMPAQASCPVSYLQLVESSRLAVRWTEHPCQL